MGRLLRPDLRKPVIPRHKHTNSIQEKPVVSKRCDMLSENSSKITSRSTHKTSNRKQIDLSEVKPLSSRRGSQYNQMQADQFQSEIHQIEPRARIKHQRNTSKQIHEDESDPMAFSAQISSDYYQISNQQSHACYQGQGPLGNEPF